MGQITPSAPDEYVPDLQKSPGMGCDARGSPYLAYPRGVIIGYNTSPFLTVFVTAMPSNFLVFQPIFIQRVVTCPFQSGASKNRF
jgi:hypothetical protein